MNSKELFALFLRMVGVVGIIIIVRHALAALPAESVPVYVLVKWAVGVLLGVYLIRGGSWVLRFAFPKSPGSAAQ